MKQRKTAGRPSERMALTRAAAGAKSDNDASIRT